MKIYRHGDLLIREVKGMPINLRRSETNILALGEATGHKHELIGDCDVFENHKNKFFVVNSTALLKHNEHKTIELAKGLYRVIHEREFSPTLRRPLKVID